MALKHDLGLMIGKRCFGKTNQGNKGGNEFEDKSGKVLICLYCSKYRVFQDFILFANVRRDLFIVISYHCNVSVFTIYNC